jgi:hypothetical protein
MVPCALCATPFFTILPIVIYTGKPEWKAATDVVDCFIKPPDGLEAF